MTNFKQIDKKIKSTYYTSDSDTIKDFLAPVLSCSKIYKRATYSFSSSIFSLINRALISVIQNNCKIYYIVGTEMRSEDIEAIEKGVKDKKGIIEKEILKEFGEIESLIIKLDKWSQDIYRFRLQVLSYLISKKILNIKVGFVSKHGKIRNPIKYKFHPKIMIFTDFEGNTIVTNGSINESLGGHSHNEETFDVFKGWNNGTVDHFNRHYNKFNDYWENKAENITTFDINDLIENEILRKYKPKFSSKTEIFEIEKKLNELMRKENPEKIIDEDFTEGGYKFPPLRAYQLKVIDNWFKLHKKGIFSLATGAGKTIAALYTIKRCLQDNERLAIIIVCPYKALCEQWVDVINYFTDFKPILAYHNKELWFSTIKHKVLSFRMRSLDRIFVVTTMDTFFSKTFQETYSEIWNNTCVIIDECHHIASISYKGLLNDNIAFRLGLSATPENEISEEGNKVLYRFFEKIIPDEYSLGEAIKDGVLSKYNYHPIISELDNEEKGNFEKILIEILKAKQEYNQKKLFELYNKRDQFLDEAKTKLPLLNNLLNKIKNISHAIIYCSGNEQLKQVSHILKDNNIIFGRITAQEKSPKDRRIILDQFRKGRIKVLLGIRVLDEGLDIPAVKTAIILKSSARTRQSIQRRGRCLRILKDEKGHVIHKDVNIYDFIVIPKYEFGSQVNQVNQELINAEIKRINEFISLSNNKEEAKQIIYQRNKNII